jgi:5-guanidino-2-oxopentanoate decarboxylase
MPNRPELSVGEALIGLLESYGVDTIFGIPGVHNVEMYRALPRSKIRHILTRHEQGAGFMADGYARATGKPGLCFTISGPGVTNILTPMGQAWSDSVNMLVIASALDIGDSAQGRGRLHEMISQHQAAKSVTAFAARAYTAKDVQNAIACSFARFASARPRPAYLEIPLDLLNRPAGQGWAATALPTRALPDIGQIKSAATKLQNAKRPMIILGGGARAAGPAATAIAENLSAPILLTTAGKGAVRADHPLCWDYRLGLPETQKIISESDCILCVGSELSETDFWNSDFIISKNLIRIDIDPETLARPHSAEIAILSDAKTALDMLAGFIIKNKVTPSQKAPPTDDSPLRKTLAQVLGVIRDNLPEETVIASDMTQIAYAANEIFPVYHPRTWLHPVGFGTLGYALPAAIGAKFGVGKTPVAALIGDYGFQYTINELGTAVEHKLPLIILLWNNDALGQIRDDMVNKGIQPNAVTLQNPDFQMLARAYGCRAERPENLKALGVAIKAALKADGPTIIEMTPRMVHG